MIAKWIVRFFVFCLFCQVSVRAQNLVKNPNFEPSKLRISVSDRQTQSLPNWSKSANASKKTGGSGNMLLGRPDDFKRFTGNGKHTHHPGLNLSGPDNYREYLHGELTRPLEMGKQYKISFYLRLHERSNRALRDIGILFSNGNQGGTPTTWLKNFSDLKYGNTHNFAEVRHWRYYKNKSGWTQVSTTITAKGNERYFTLGNFRDDRRSEPLPVPGDLEGAFYYVDKMAVTALRTDYAYHGPRPRNSYPLEDVIFEDGSYVLDEAAKSELDLWYNELKKDPSIFLSVHAYADAKGSGRKREKLSSKRARSVARYLVTQGLPIDRIRWLGDEMEAGFAGYVVQETEEKKHRAEFTISNKAFKARSSMAETLFEDDH